MEELQGRRVLVTGGGSGIGFGIAERFLTAGAYVTIAGIDAEMMNVAEARLHDSFPSAELTSYCCDITQEEQVKELISGMGQLDILVANAGSGSPGPILELGVDMWRYATELNVIGTALCLKHGGLAMKSHGGSILTISSVAAVRPGKFMAPYSATKAAVEMMTRCAAVELAPFDIRVNCIAPGFVVTEATTQNLDAAFTDLCKKETLLNRFGRPADIADSALYLCGDQSRWVTGQILRVDGGISQHYQDFEYLSRNIYGDDIVNRCL